MRGEAFPAVGSRWRYARRHRRWGGRVLTVVGWTSWGAVVVVYDGARAPVCVGGPERFGTIYAPADSAPAPPQPLTECRERL
jgi:hypothetical protein